MSSFAADLLTFVIFTAVLALIVVSQYYWLVRIWRLAASPKNPSTRLLFQTVCVAAFALFVFAIGFNLIFNFALQSKNLMWRRAGISAWTGLWFSSALFAYLAVKGVALVAKLPSLFGRVLRKRSNSQEPQLESVTQPANQPLAVDPTRRRLVQSATIVAGAIPFGAAAYGFLFERLRYQVRHVDLPIAGLPAALAGMRIAHLSDIHIGSYMSGPDVRRAVAMTNELSADIVAVTGDFVTGRNDPLELCIAELSRLRAPLGVWGCNGNHEIYAGVEALSARLFAHYGMRLLRQESAELVWHNQAFNLIGVDYQRQRRVGSTFRPMLSSIEHLVRRDVPNILLSHNPNSFRRAAELGIEAMLTGHTHGGQVRVEIVDHQFTPARFLTPYVAGMYRRPMGAPAALDEAEIARHADAATHAGSAADVNSAASASAALSSSAALAAPRASVLYVNVGLGTIGAPVRLGVPPEITLHTLRCA